MIAGPQRRRHVRQGRGRLCRDRRGALAGRPRPRRRRRGRGRQWLSGAIATAARPSPVRRLRRGRPYGARRLGGGIAFEACCCVGTRRDVERQAQAPLSVPAIKTLRLFALRRPSYLAAAAISSLLRVGRRSMRREPKANSNLFRANNRTVLLPSDRSRKLCSCWLRLPSLRSVVTPLCTSLHQEYLLIAIQPQQLNLL